MYVCICMMLVFPLKKCAERNMLGFRIYINTCIYEYVDIYAFIYVYIV